MMLWTIQPKEVWEKGFVDGVFRCDSDHPEIGIDRYEQFLDAYEWIAEEMMKWIGPAPKGVKYPIWAYHTWDGKHKKPDLRQRQTAPGTECVCLTIEIPDEQVLLSDFDLWHLVLGKHYISELPLETDEDYDKEDAWLESLDTDTRDRVTRDSWSNIFDVVPGTKHVNSDGDYIQAVFWELRKEQVKKVQFFKSK
ncbi:DUF3841 domain-containing protein [Ohessyouella blattaphilus]|uniref:DUF3841 domain-containing protein n=1 Tax=Ohessyouella blattaphilus TaxID=2949333 RepID=A0ABT1EJP4_9FIRM|nr:DUF3841 domain-containing protein [Ohessyouella blattaphilus]MCP1110910.1 DUF3841 domain-containing protein [Ohessyouella blattaphilus]MCR8564304.1 DUF3841 domain-containing protein [Ohessyouella blattaphilus]